MAPRHRLRDRDFHHRGAEIRMWTERECVIR
jgi:hypothetical protein